MLVRWEEISSLLYIIISFTTYLQEWHWLFPLLFFLFLSRDQIRVKVDMQKVHFSILLTTYSQTVEDYHQSGFPFAFQSFLSSWACIRYNPVLTEIMLSHFPTLRDDAQFSHHSCSGHSSNSLLLNVTHQYLDFRWLIFKEWSRKLIIFWSIMCSS